MAIFDVTEPPNTDKVGDGARVIRVDLKTIFTTLFEGKVVEVLAALWECVKGWPRAYVADLAAPPSPPAAAKDGRLWLVGDKGTAAGHDGTNWLHVNNRDIRIPLNLGVPQKFDTVGAWTAKGFGFWVAGAPGDVEFKPFRVATDEGFRFNKALAPTKATIHFAAGAACVDATNLGVRLYDVVGAAEVAGSQLDFADASVEDLQTADLTAAITAGDRRFRVQINSTAGEAVLFYAELRIVRA